MVLHPTDPTGIRDPDHHRHREASAGAVAHLGDVADHLLERGVAERVELHLDDRPEALHREPDGEPGDAGLGQRGVEAAVLAELRGQPVGDPEDAAEGADVLTEDQHVLVLGQGVAQRRVQRLGEGDGGHPPTSCAPSCRLISWATSCACSRSCGVGSA